MSESQQSVDHIAKALESVVFAYVTQRGFRLGDGADNDFRRFTIRAAREIEQQATAEEASIDELSARASANFFA